LRSAKSEVRIRFYLAYFINILSSSMIGEVRRVCYFFQPICYNDFMNSQEAFARQKEVVEYYAKNNPAMVDISKPRPEEEVFPEIGITRTRPNRLDGYLRLFPQDFIVEEILADGEIIRVNDFNDEVSGEGKTLYAHLIKIGIPTNAALQRLGESFGLEENQIGYSGLKDADALTAQMVALTKLQLSAAQISSEKIDNLLLTSLRYGPGSLSPGSLRGNEFTITIRTNGQINKEEFVAAVDEISEKGLLNYYQAQRFGGGRLISHKLGLLLARGDYETAVKFYLLKKGDYSMPIMDDIRSRAEAKYPDWASMEKIYEEFPYSFFGELRLVGFLKNDPQNLVGGLTCIKDQTTLWVYAYASWLFNKRISENAGADGKLPLLLSRDTKINLIYGKYLAEDGTGNFRNNLAPFKFIRMADREVKTKILAEISRYKFFSGGVVINFGLPKGAYATTFLSNFFRLTDNYPVPNWASREEIDPKRLLGQGSLDKIKEKFAANWHSKLAGRQF
jgi:TruD family tRNA pseudouridine synthase